MKKEHTFGICETDETGSPEIPLEAFHTLQPISLRPLEWVEPTDRGDERPTVINNTLIQEMYKTYSEISPTHEEQIKSGRQVRFNEMRELYLEYLNILHIENLEKCENLTKLSLNNNIIETPVGLGSLIHLEELDLSYNKLTKLDSIHLLRKLRVLRLNNNLLESISILKYNYRCLEVLNLGYNKLSNFFETLLYLSALPSLKFLSLDGNPLWGPGKKTDRDLKILLFFYLPQLRFYEHRIITFSEIYPTQAEVGESVEDCFTEEDRRNIVVKKIINSYRDKAPDMVLRLDGIRTEILAMDEADSDAHNKLALESVLDHLCLAGFRYGKGFNALMKKDIEGQDLMSISKRVKDEVFGRLEESMEPVILDLTHNGILFFRKRQECIDRYIRKWDYEVEKHGDYFMEALREFLKQKKSIQENLLIAFNSDNSTEQLAERNMKEVLLYDKEFIILTKKIWWDLMDKEMAVHGKLEDLFEALDEELVEMIRVYVEPFQEKIVKLRKVEEEFFEYLMDFMNRYVNELISNKWERLKLNEHHKKILFSSETRNNIMTQCHDNHTSFIDIEEEEAVDQLKKWQVHVAETCRKIESENNRNEVDGLHKLIVKHKMDWEEAVGEALRTAYTFLWVVDPRWTKEVMYFKMNYEDRELFDVLEEQVKKKALDAIETRKENEKLKAIAAQREADRRLEIERKMQMKRLKSLVDVLPPTESQILAAQKSMSEKEKTKDTALKEIAQLKEIDLSFENLKTVVLNDECVKREARRKKKEREWKAQGDVGRHVHVVGGKNLRVYHELKEKIMQSESDTSIV